MDFSSDLNSDKMYSPDSKLKHCPSILILTLTLIFAVLGVEGQDVVTGNNVTRNNSFSAPTVCQSFTATTSGVLKEIRYQGCIAAGSTLKIYDGAGTGGNELATQTITNRIHEFDNGEFVTITIDTTLPITNGQVYTYCFSGSGSGCGIQPVSMSLRADGPYAGGRIYSSLNISAESGYDAVFEVVQTTNAAPTATQVNAAGTLVVGKAQLGTYVYSDTNNDPESGSTYKWYRSDDNAGTNKAAINGATDTLYTLTTGDLGKFISFEVTPNDGKTTGTSVESTLRGPVVQLELTLSIEDSISCNGNMDGKISAVGSSGTPPYTFSWNTAATSDTLSNLAAGTYTVTLTDSLGIQVTDSIVLTEPNVLNVSANLDSNVSCNGLSNGGASTTVSGGTAPYTYSWSNGSTQSALQNAAAGTYKVTVTDKNGCQDSATVSITEPQVMQLTLSADSNVTCNGGNNGGASAVVNGGTTPYTYSWSNGITNSSINGVGAGQYILTVTDSNQCTVTDTVIITEPATLTLNQVSISQHVSCKGGNDGMANVNVSGGTPPYTYSWNNGSQTVQGNNNLPSGTFTLTVTDANGCTVNQSNITVNEPDKLEGGTIN